MSQEANGWYIIDTQQICVLFHLSLACLCGLMCVVCPNDTLNNYSCVSLLCTFLTPLHYDQSPRPRSLSCFLRYYLFLSWGVCCFLLLFLFTSDLFLNLSPVQISFAQNSLGSSPFISLLFFLLLPCCLLGTSGLFVPCNLA